MAEGLRINCVHCGSALFLPIKWRDPEAKCPSCNALVAVPDAALQYLDGKRREIKAARERERKAAKEREARKREEERRQARLKAQEERERAAALEAAQKRALRTERPHGAALEEATEAPKQHEKRLRTAARTEPDPYSRANSLEAVGIVFLVVAAIGAAGALLAWLAAFGEDEILSGLLVACGVGFPGVVAWALLYGFGGVLRQLYAIRGEIRLLSAELSRAVAQRGDLPDIEEVESPADSPEQE